MLPSPATSVSLLSPLASARASVTDRAGDAEPFDYIIVGAGSAGCVLAHRLSENPAHRVLLIEAGPETDNLIVRMPKGFGKLLFDRQHVRRFEVEPEAGSGGKSESWPRGMMLGGSSAVNGLFYTRGQPQDYDDWAAAGAQGWGWDQIGRCFRAIEDHALGDDGVRGVGGPLHVAEHPAPHPLCEAVIAAGVQQGLPRRRDLNGLDQEGIGYVPLTIKDGVRVSAATAFLAPIRGRANLTILSRTQVRRIRFEGQRAVGVCCLRKGRELQFDARREVIVSAGAIQTPQLLQLSGVGPGAHLHALGIPVIQDLPGVGANLREHHMLTMQFRIKRPLSLNREFSGWRLGKNLVRYLATHKGLMASGSHDVLGFFRTRPDLTRPDAELVMAPFSLRSGTEMAFEREHGIQFFGYQLRPESAGSVRIRSANPATDPQIRPNVLSAEIDRQTSADIARYIRVLAAQPALREFISAETSPGLHVRSNEELLTYHQQHGGSVHHSAGTCKMGTDAMAVVDYTLRVKGVRGLRVMDASVMPTLVSAHTNGPVMAMAWRAAELILADQAVAAT